MIQKINTDTLRLKDILQAIDDINEAAANGLDNRTSVMAVAYGVAIIGEAANKLSHELQNRYTDIPWKQIVGMRHRIIHDYGMIKVERLREVVAHDLPVLKEQITHIMKEIM